MLLHLFCYTCSCDSNRNQTILGRFAAGSEMHYRIYLHISLFLGREKRVPRSTLTHTHIIFLTSCRWRNWYIYDALADPMCLKDWVNFFANDDNDWDFKLILDFNLYSEHMSEEWITGSKIDLYESIYGRSSASRPIYRLWIHLISGRLTSWGLVSFGVLPNDITVTPLDGRPVLLITVSKKY